MAEAENYLEIIEAVKASGKIKKGVNEVTKSLERGSAKLVVSANDVSPKEITMHLPMLAKEKGVPYGEASSKEELGAAAGIQKPTSAVAVEDAGKAKDMINALSEESSQKEESKKQGQESSSQGESQEKGSGEEKSESSEESQKEESSQESSEQSQEQESSSQEESQEESNQESQEENKQ